MLEFLKALFRKIKGPDFIDIDMKYDKKGILKTKPKTFSDIDEAHRRYREERGW